MWCEYSLNHGGTICVHHMTNMNAIYPLSNQKVCEETRESDQLFALLMSFALLWGSPSTLFFRFS